MRTEPTPGVADDAIPQVNTNPPSRKPHRWSPDGETCLDCGDRDWRASSNCEPLPPPAAIPEPTPPTDHERHHAFEWLRELGLSGDNKTARLAYVAMQTMLSPPAAVPCLTPASPSGEDGERGGGTELSLPEGQRAPCPEAGNDGDALACPPSGGEPPQDPVEWVKERWRKLVSKVVDDSDYFLYGDDALELAHRCRDAEKLVLLTAKDARDTAHHRNQLMDQLAAAQARANEAEKPGWYQSCLQIGVILAPLTKADGIVDAVREVVERLDAAQARVAELEAATNSKAV